MMNPLLDVFQVLNKSANYAVLRNYDSLPESMGRDIDIIIKYQDFKILRNKIVEIFVQYGYCLFQYYRGSEMQSFVFIENRSPYKIISFDFLFSIYIKDVVLLTSEQVLKTKEFNGKIYHVRKDMEFLSKYLYNLILKTAYPEKYKNIREVAYSLYGPEINTVLSNLGINEKNNSLLKIRFNLLHKHFFRTINAYFRYLYYTINNLIFSQGISIGFTGPDGVGKTTIINQIIEIFKKLYSSVPVYHFRPTIIGNLGEVAYSAGLKKDVDRNFSEPHRGRKTGKLNSFLRLSYYSFDYLIGYISKVKLQIFKRKIIIFDRYYTDIICDSRRTRIYLNYKILYWFGKIFIPSLNYNILLTAKSETILSRKRELDEDGIKLINNKIDYLSDKKGYKKILNEQTPEVAVAEILNYVFDSQHKKNLKRLK